MKKILIIGHSLIDCINFERTITSKILNELDKYYILEYSLFSKKDSSYEKNKSIKYTKVPFNGTNFFNKILNIIFIYYTNIKEIKKTNSDLIWIEFLPPGLMQSLFFIYKICSKKKIYIQLYTPSVDEKKYKRLFFNTIASFNLKFFNYIGAVGRINIETFNLKKRQVVPVKVGYPDYGFQNKEFNNMKLVYLGTLSSREIWKSVKGLNFFIDANPNVKISYDIIGMGNQKDVVILNQEIIKNNLQKIVTYHGYLPFIKVKKIFQLCNIGVSYLPNTDYFQISSTKTIEYLLNGMCVIATANKFMSDTINEESGVLCDDSPEGFSLGLKKLHNRFSMYNSEEIYKMYKQYSMEETMKSKYIPSIDKIINGEL